LTATSFFDTLPTINPFPNKPYPMLQELSKALLKRFCLVTIFSLAFFSASADGWATTQLTEGTGDGLAMTPLPEAGVNAAPIADLVGAIRGGRYKNIRQKPYGAFGDHRPPPGFLSQGAGLAGRQLLHAAQGHGQVRTDVPEQVKIIAKGIKRNVKEKAEKESTHYE